MDFVENFTETDILERSWHRTRLKWIRNLNVYGNAKETTLIPESAGGRTVYTVSNVWWEIRKSSNGGKSNNDKSPWKWKSFLHTKGNISLSLWNVSV